MPAAVPEQHGLPVASPPDYNRQSAQLRVMQQFDRCIEGIHIQMGNAPVHWVLPVRSGRGIPEIASEGAPRTSSSSGFSRYSTQILRSVMSGGVESADRVPSRPAAVTPIIPVTNPLTHIHGLKI